MLEQQHHGGVQQHRGLVEHILQGHQAHAGANVQPGLMQIPGLHRHGTRAQGDHVAKGAAPGVVDALPQGEAGQPPPHDDVGDAALQQRVADAQRQHHQHLPQVQLGKGGCDLGPVIPEDEHDHAGECQQDQQGKHGLFAGRLRGGRLVHEGRDSFQTG